MITVKTSKVKNLINKKKLIRYWSLIYPSQYAENMTRGVNS
jgi:hypothetical protein